MKNDIEAGQERTAVIAGRLERVQVLGHSRYNRNYWICKAESSGKRFALPEDQLRDSCMDEAEVFHAALDVEAFVDDLEKGHDAYFRGNPFRHR